MFSPAKLPIWCCFILTTNVFAEGIVNVNPYVSTSISYDDNLFRFSSEQAALAAQGSSDQSDMINRLDFGLQANVRLSRQIMSLSANVSDSKFNRNSRLDNTGGATNVRWDWRLASKLYGELSASETKAISDFNDVRFTGKNIRTNSRKLASINWDIHPDWTVYASREYVDLDNQLETLRALNRSDVSTESGVRYRNTLNTQLGLAYRQSDSGFDGRTGTISTALGASSQQDEFVVTATWEPSAKTQISTRLSQVTLTRPNSQLSDFSGFNQRWNLGYKLSDKININLSAYRGLSPVDDIVSTFVTSSGYSINPSWNISSKLTLLANVNLDKRDFVGSVDPQGGLQNRDDQSVQVGASLQYAPTQHAFMQVQYLGEKRNSNTPNTDYQFNNLNVVFRYNF